jgi:hypothetical protein
VAFTFDFEQKKKGLENICPEWEEKNIAEIDRDTSSSVCYITPDEDFKELEGIKDSKLIEQYAVTQNKLFLWDFYTPYLLVT